MHIVGFARRAVCEDDSGALACHSEFANVAPHAAVLGPHDSGVAERVDGEHRARSVLLGLQLNWYEVGPSRRQHRFPWHWPVRCQSVVHRASAAHWQERQRHPGPGHTSPCPHIKAVRLRVQLLRCGVPRACTSQLACQRPPMLFTRLTVAAQRRRPQFVATGDTQRAGALRAATWDPSRPR